MFKCAFTRKWDRDWSGDFGAALYLSVTSAHSYIEENERNVRACVFSDILLTMYAPRGRNIFVGDLMDSHSSSENRVIFDAEGTVLHSCYDTIFDTICLLILFSTAVNDTYRSLRYKSIIYIIRHDTKVSFSRHVPFRTILKVSTPAVHTVSHDTFVW